MEYIFYILFFYLINLSKGEYKIYWNVPTQSCHKYGLNFSYLENIGILQNSKDKFKGDKITILYDPGFFPAIINGGDRNGGLPQDGNLNIHLERLEKDLDLAIPNKDFDGVGIIDFEHWRPIYRENWASLDIYRKRSKERERKKHPFWSDKSIEKEASTNFEKFAYEYFDQSLKLVMKKRPKARWGYYAFPYCFNFSAKNPVVDCSSETKKDNDRSEWMFKTGNALFPSAYLQQNKLNPSKNAKLIQGRAQEALRIAKKGPIQVFPYVWFKYQDTKKFLNKEDMSNSILVPKKTGTSGVIIWGSTNDVNTKEKCQKLDEYTKNVIRKIINKKK